MANTYRLGGSPLGLINVLSRPTRDGMSTFNAGNSRNVNVSSYNRSGPQETNIVQGGKPVFAARSLMSGGSIPNFFPNPDPIGNEVDIQGLSASTQFSDPNDSKYRSLPSRLHNDRIYDMSLLNIIEMLSKAPSAALRPGDFAYLKNIGVFPNNRLMIARRFSGPIGDNIFGKSSGVPKSVLIGWKSEDEDFLEFTFGEEWIDADADFTGVLNRIGSDIGLDKSGDALGKALNLVPLPGLSEVLQRRVLVSLGILEEGGKDTPLPAGNPNIIKMAKRRKTIGYGVAESGLRCVISVKMSVEYEQKFISGIDPSIAFMDILNNILIFGTSKADDYGISAKFTKNLKTYLNDPSQLIRDIIEGIKSGIGELITKVSEKVDTLLKADETKTKTPTYKERVESAKETINTFLNEVNTYFKQYLSKYKVEILGIANALSGAPSTPWHITLGNPLRPFFCSGDMLAGDVTMKFGPTLAFNDLPSNIKAEFTLTNARPLGLQEILAKFNVGHLRVVNIRRDFIETNDQTGEKATLGQGANLYFDEVFSREGVGLNESIKKPPIGGSPSVATGDNAQTTSSVNSSTEQLKREESELAKIKTEKGETSTEYTTALAAYNQKKVELGSQAQNTQVDGANLEDKSSAASNGTVDPTKTTEVGDNQNSTQGGSSNSV